MKHLLPPNFKQPHPETLKKIDSNSRFVSATVIEPEVVDGKRICPWCRETEIPSIKRKYCSEDCKNSCYSFLSPTQEKGLILARCDNKCQGCGFDYHPYFLKVQEHFKDQGYQMTAPLYQAMRVYPTEVGPFPNNWFIQWMISFLESKEKAPEFDHITALALGGSGISLDNLQVLCHECHAKKTKQDMVLIRKQAFDKI